MRPLSFCHLTTFYPPYNFGGDGMGIQRLCRGLARRGHAVTVVHDADAYNALRRGHEPAPERDPDGIEVVPMKSGFGTLSPFLVQQLGRPMLNAGRLRRLLAEGSFDVINYHNASLIGGPGLWALGDAVKLHMAHEHWLVCPTHVLWRHGREVCTGRECLRCALSYRRPPQLWRWTSGLQRRAHHVDTFIAMSEFSRAKHREFGFEPEMEVLPYFLPDPEPGDDPAGPPVPPVAESPHPRPYFLFVGRLEKIKGLDDVIPLFRDYAEADLLIAGDGEYAQSLRSLARGIERVRFLGRVAPDQLARYYRHSVALIVPSTCFETFGIILIEAFRAGTPVIARRIGPFPEIVERSGAGELFGTAEELVAAMRRLQGDPALRERYVKSGYRAFVENWSESAVVPAYLELVRKAAARRGDDKVLAALQIEHMKVFITGGAGFIGSHLAEQLIERGDHVLVLDDLSTGEMDNIDGLVGHERFGYRIGDVNDRPLVAELVDRCDVTVHLAAAVGVRLIVERPVHTIETNVHGTEVVLGAAARKQKPVLIASTSEVYGKGTQFPFREDADLTLGATKHSRWAYACSKALDEWLALAYWHEKRVPTTIVRFFNTVGPRQTGRYGMVLPTFAAQAIRGEPITVYGSGEQSRCFGHVQDVVEAVIRLMECPEATGEVFNVGNDTEVTIRQLAELVRDEAGSSSEILLSPYDEAYPPGFEDMQRRVPDCSKLEQAIGFKPTTPLETIIADVVRDQRARLG